MAVTINRAPWNALVDDSGQNLDGSIWNKAAIKTVLLDPIDAAFGGAATVLAKTSGSYGATAGAVLTSVVIPALGVADTLRLGINFGQFSQAGTQLYLSIPGDVVLINLHDIGGGSLAVNARGIWDVTLRQTPSTALAWDILAVGGAGAGAPPSGTRITLPAPTTANWQTGGWTLALVSGGQTAGATEAWSWSVIRI